MISRPVWIHWQPLLRCLEFNLLNNAGMFGPRNTQPYGRPSRNNNSACGVAVQVMPSGMGLKRKLRWEVNICK